MVSSVSHSSDISLSGLLAAQTQLAATASNIANSSDTGTPPTSSAPFGSSAVAAPPLTGTQPSNAAGQVFQALTTTQTATNGGGTAVSVSRSSEFTLSYQPDNPQADSQGLVASPNVNPVQQTVELANASNAFAANLQALKVSTDISKRVLDVTT